MLSKVKRALTLFVLLFSIFQVFAAKQDLSNPQSAVKTHLDFLAEEGDGKKASLALYGPNLTPQEKVDLAWKLKQIFDGEGHKILTDLIPDDANYIDEKSGNEVYVVDTSHKELYLKKIDGQWMYSEQSVKQINAIHKKVYPYGTHRLVKFFSQSKGGTEVLGLNTWQLTGILIVGISSVLLYAFAVVFFRFLILKVFNRFTTKRVYLENVKPLVKPMSLLLVFFFLNLFLPVLQLPIDMGRFLILGSKAAIPFFVMVFAYKLVDVISDYFESLAEKTESKLDDQLVPLVRKALKAFVVIIGILFVLQNLNFNITALLAGISIGGLALALAAQDMLKNFFGSIMIFLDRPFQIGDWIIGPSIDGSVEEVGFRTTRVRTFGNSLVSVPNGKLADATIDNMGKRWMRRYKTMIAVTYDTPPQSVEAFVTGLRKIVDDHPYTVKDNYHVYLNQLGASSLDILFYIFFDVPDWGAELRSRHEVNLSIIKLAEELDVRFAFNTQTIHIEDFPEKQSLTPGEYPEREELNKRVGGFQLFK